MEIPTLTREELLTKWKPVIDRTFDIFTWTSGHELAFLCELASRASRIAEIGAYHGKSAKCMSLANPSAFLTVVDLSQDDRCRIIRNTNLLSDHIRVLEGTARQNETVLKADGPYQVGFIDGGHLEADVTTDIEILLPLMAPGGIIAGHDWRHNNPLDGVNVAVEKAFDKHRIRVFESIWHVQL